MGAASVPQRGPELLLLTNLEAPELVRLREDVMRSLPSLSLSMILAVLACHGSPHRTFTYTVVFTPRDGEYGILIPAFPGVSAHAKTMEEARGLADFTIRMGIENLRREGRALPMDVQAVAQSGVITEGITVDLDAKPPVDVQTITVGSNMARATPFDGQVKRPR